MKNNIFKYAMLLAVGLGLAACNSDEELGLEAPMQPEAQQQNSALTFQASFGNTLQKASISFNNNYAYTYCQSGDTMSVFSSAENCKFTCGFSDWGYMADNRTHGFASFSGEAKTSDAYYALSPYQSAAKINGNVISARIPETFEVDSAYYDNPLPEGVLYVGYTKQADRSFYLRNAAALLSLYVSDYSDDASKKIAKVEVKASKNISGDVKITVAEDANPQISGGTSQTVAVINPRSGRVFIPILPVKDFDVTVTYTCKDGSSFSEDFKGLSASAGDILYADNAAMHTVKFADGISKDEKIVHGNYYTLPFIDKMNDDNMILAGWKDAQGNEYAMGERISVYSDMEFSPIWKDGYLVSFGYYGSIRGTLPSSFVVEDGETATLPGTDGFSSLYEFRGWYCNGSYYNPGDKVKISSNTTFYADWYYDKPITFKVTIDADGGKFADGKGEMVWEFKEYENSRIEFSYYDDATGLRGMAQSYYPIKENGDIDWNNWTRDVVPYPVKEGYAVSGMYSDIISNDGTMSETGLYMSAYKNNFRDYKVKFKWSKKYDLEYLDADGKVLSSDYLLEGATYFYTFNKQLSVEGKTHIGWKDQDGNVYEFGQKVDFSEPKNLKFTPVLTDSKPSSTENWGWDTLN